MGNNYLERMSLKSDIDLNIIIKKRELYHKDASLAAITILEQRDKITPEIIKIKEELLHSENNSESIKVELEKENKKTFSETVKSIVPSQSYFITPIIIYINVLIYVLMFFSGFNPFESSIETLIYWGGNLRELTLNGQQWRLLSNIFIHDGLIHLIFNTYTLLFIGKELETNLGKKNFLFSYIITGIFASLSSIFFNVNIVSIGSSGAVFGMYGIITVLLFKKSFILAKDRKKSYVNSIFYILIYNVINGFKYQGIDNAAHIGGYLCGVILGLTFYNSPKYSTWRSLVIAVIIILLISNMPMIISNSE